jgi:hypothetical protein
MIKYEYKNIKGYEQKKFIENGHTMFEEDVLTRLKRLAYLESERKKTKNATNRRLRKGVLTENNKKIEVYFHLFGFDSDGEACAILETEEGNLLTKYASLFKFTN